MYREIRKYKNAVVAYGKNRRIFVYRKCKKKSTSEAEPETFVGITTRILDGRTSPRTTHTVIKGKVVETTMYLSTEGASALYQALRVYFSNQKNMEPINSGEKKQNQ